MTKIYPREQQEPSLLYLREPRGSSPRTKRPDKATYLKAIAILGETMKPWRPSELFRVSFTPVNGHEGPVGREAERFREHFAKEFREVVKAGPWFGLRRWLVPRLPFITEEDYLTIQFSGQVIRWAELEARQRLRYMVVRNPNVSPARREAACHKGMRVQAHVMDFFKKGWPEFYRPPSNAEYKERPAPEDFMLVLPVRNKPIKVDVATAESKRPLRFWLRGDKMQGADCIVVAFDNEQGVVVCGYTTEPLYGQECDEAHIKPIEQMIARLNILQAGLCLEDFEAAAGNQV